MTITQNELIKQIADKEDINVATVRKIFNSAEDIIFDHLSSAPPSENIIVKVLNGIIIERKFVKSKTYTKGMFRNIDCPEHVNVKASYSKYFNKLINQKLFNK